MGIVTYSTDDAAKLNSRVDWIVMVHRHLDSLEVEIGESESFHGSFSSATVGENRVSFVRADVQNIRRAPRHRDRGAPLYHLIYVREGQFDLDSVTYKGRLKAGEWIALTNQEAFHFETSPACSCVVLHLANQWLRNFLPDPAGIIQNQNLDRNAWHESLRYCLQAISDMPIQTMGGDGGLALEQVPQRRAECGGFIEERRYGDRVLEDAWSRERRAFAYHARRGRPRLINLDAPCSYETHDPHKLRP